MKAEKKLTKKQQAKVNQNLITVIELLRTQGGIQQIIELNLIERLLDGHEAGALLGITNSGVKGFKYRPDCTPLPYVKLSGGKRPRVRYRLSDVLKYIQEMETHTI